MSRDFPCFASCRRIWHGSPRTYHSSYGADVLARFRRELELHDAADRWCIFDNTASEAAALNARELQSALT